MPDSDLQWRTERRRVCDLTPYPHNPRRLSEKQAADLEKSLRRFNLAEIPAINTDNTIIAGHMRLRLLAKMGRGDEMIDVRVPSRQLAEQEVAEYCVRSNRNTGEWDFDILANDFDLDNLKDWGFDDKDLLGIGGGSASADEDEFDTTLAENPVVRPGDVWTLGVHRLMCGDSTNPQHVERLLAGATPFMMVTDPPYGVEYDPEWRQRAGLQDGGAYGKPTNDDRADWREAWVLFPGDVAYVWHASGENQAVVLSSLAASGFEARNHIIWAKQHLVIGRGHYHHQHEPCWYVVRRNAKSRWCGDRKQTTLWQIDKPRKSETGHSTQKPVECMARPIRNHGGKGDDVYDPFVGSGTTIVAAEGLGRRCYAMEISPAYCDMAIKRWAKKTGEEAVRDDGVKWSELAGHPGEEIDK